MMKICVFERSNEKNNFHKKTTPQLLGHIGLQNTKVEEKRILGDLPQYFKFVRWMLTSSLNTFFLLTGISRFLVLSVTDWV